MRQQHSQISINSGTLIAEALKLPATGEPQSPEQDPGQYAVFRDEYGDISDISEEGLACLADRYI